MSDSLADLMRTYYSGGDPDAVADLSLADLQKAFFTLYTGDDVNIPGNLHVFGDIEVDGSGLGGGGGADLLDIHDGLTTDDVIRIYVDADTQKRLIVNAGGTIEWGSGSVAVDTNLYRSAANTLKTDDSFIVAANLTASGTSTLTGAVSAPGGVTGALTGNVTGNVTGDLTGNVTGDLTGNVTGNVTGDLTGDVTGDHTGNTTINGDLHVTGDITVDGSGLGGGGTFDPDLVGSSGDDVLTSHVTGDAEKRWILNAEGKQEWGDGTNAVDTNLYRSAANKLKTDDALDVTGTLAALGNATVGGTLGITGTTTAAAVNATTLSSSGATTANSLGVTNNATVGGTLGITGTTTAAAINGTAITASGNMQCVDHNITGDMTLADDMTLAAGSVLTWATDTNLYRSAADTLKTDDSFVIGNDLTITDDLDIGDDVTLAAGSVMTWATDTNLYRSAADKLKTDDALDVAGTLAALGNATVGGTLGITGTTTAAAVNATTLSSSGATSPASLAVTNNATVGGTLGITGATTAAAITASGTVTLNAAATTIASGNTFTWGADTTLYRSAGDTLKTDDSFVVGTNLSVTGTSALTGAVTTTGALTVGTDLSVGGIGKTMFVYKGSDESVTSSSTLQDDNELVSPTLATNVKYLVECQVFYTSTSATPGVKFSWVGPTSATMVWGAGAGYIGNSTIGAVDAWSISASAFDQALYTGILVTAGSTGTLQLQWAQNTSNGTATTVKAGSWLRLTRVA